MSINSTRRGFIKGMMAAAGLVVVAPYLPLDIQQVAAAEPERMPEKIENGDIWIEKDGVTRFLGVASNLTFQRTISEIDISPIFHMPYREMTRGIESTTLTIEASLDAASKDFMYDLMSGFSGFHLYYGLGGRLLDVKDCILFGVDWGFNKEISFVKLTIRPGLAALNDYTWA